jgi:acetyl esterase
VPLDIQARALIDRFVREGTPPVSRLTPTEARQLAREVNRRLTPPPEAVAVVKNTIIAGPSAQILLRVYIPREDEILPVLAYFHGGGWVLGDLDSVDSLCRSLAKAANCVVVSVDYRLAPEHKFPAAVEDAYSATKWIADNATVLSCDPRRIAVGGDSAGGNLAAVVSIMARDRGGPEIVHQLLIYPVMNCKFDTASYLDNEEGYWLAKDDMKWFWNHYLRDEEDGRNPYASPLLEANLSSLPPAFVITAEFDPLRDEGEAYAARLGECGVPVKLTRYDGMIHDFVNIAELRQSRVALDEAAAELRDAFAIERLMCGDPRLYEKP